MREATSEALGTLAALGDPLRLTLYRHVASQPGWVGRDQAAQAAGISRPLAAYHLDRLLDAGLLDVQYRRPEGRGGPGAGRPAKVYRRSRQVLEVSVPPRRYRLAAELLVTAIDGASRGRSVDRLGEVARDFGRRLGAGARGVRGTRPSRRSVVDRLHGELQAVGFEPTEAGPAITLSNCPFEMLTHSHPDVVCGMNLALVEGLIEGVGMDGAVARLDPKAGRCCVVVTTDRAPATDGPRPGDGQPMRRTGRKPSQR